MRRLLRHIANRIGQFTGRRPRTADQPSPVNKPASPSAGVSAPPRPAPPRPGPRAPRPSARPVPVPPTTKTPTTKTPPTKTPPTTAVRPGHNLVYAPNLDGRADPGEIVWTWVPYEEDASKGKDRPIVVMGRDGDVLTGLMLSSNADRDSEREWLALGRGEWDRDHRPSWVRLDRVIEIPETGIRREGAVLDRKRFDAIAAELRRHHGWT